MSVQQHKYLNLGCGFMTLPGDKPPHHALIQDNVHQYAQWHNVDRNPSEGVDQVFDLFSYPWPLDDCAYDGALLAHLLEHVPYEIAVQEPDPTLFDDPLAYMCAFMEAQRLKQALNRKYQGGWLCFMGELHRVLTPGAMVHVLSPYAWSQGAATDFTHQRMITEQLFTHNSPGSPFHYADGGAQFKLIGYTFSITEPFQHLTIMPGDGEEEVQRKDRELRMALTTNINVCYDIYAKLECVK